MNNFLRALRLALKYRLNVAGCLLSGLAVALLWGGNLTAVYPVVDVIMNDRAVPEWMDEQLADCEAQVTSSKQKIVDLREQQVDVAEGTQEAKIINGHIKEAEWNQYVYSQQVRWYSWAAPRAHQYLPDTPFKTLLAVCGFVLVGTLLKSIFRICHTILSARLGHLVGYDLRRDFYRQMLRLDLKNFSEQGRGDLMNRCTTDLNWVSSGVQTVAGQGLLEPLKVAVCLSLAAYVSWRLLLFTMIIAPLTFLIIRWLAKSLKRAHRRTMQELSAIYETLSETLGAIKLIKAFTMESAERGRFKQSAKLYYRRQMKTARYNSLVSPVTELLGILMVLLASIAGGYLVLNQQTDIFGFKISDIPLTHGWMSVFFAMMAGMADPARRLSSVFGGLQQSIAAADRVYEVLDREPDVIDPGNPIKLPVLKDAIRLENVDFHYTSDKPVLTGVNLEIRAGETIAFVGTNGCGKSTLLNLIPRFYDPNQGRVTIDGVDVRDVRIRDLRSRIGLVSQETVLFDDTIAENIAYGSINADQSTIKAAARKAYAHSFITERLTDGYDTLVGPGGNKLSGGQRQRIALARAILRDPEILILDEATSQIDLESEQLIHRVLKEFLEDRVALVVTHRMSTISLADRVAVMHEGGILDIGTHDELMGRCKIYQRLASLGYRESA